MKLCNYGGCKTITKNVRCERHRTNYKKRKTYEHDPFYNSARWSKIATRHKYLEPLCQECGLEPTSISDHVIELNDLKPNSQLFVDGSNLRGLCSHCHADKTVQVARARKEHQLHLFYEFYCKRTNRSEAYLIWLNESSNLNL